MLAKPHEDLTNPQSEGIGHAENQALTIFPARKQPVHTDTRLGEPLIRARTDWMFGFHRRFVRT